VHVCLCLSPVSFRLFSSECALWCHQVPLRPFPSESNAILFVHWLCRQLTSADETESIETNLYFSVVKSYKSLGYCSNWRTASNRRLISPAVYFGQTYGHGRRLHYFFHYEWCLCNYAGVAFKLFAARVLRGDLRCCWHFDLESVSLFRQRRLSAKTLIVTVSALNDTSHI